MPQPLPSLRCVLRRHWRRAAATVATTVAGLALALSPARAQVDTYQFAASAGTFTALPATATAVPAVQDDDAISGAVPIGFSFAFDGVPYTSVYASSNGFLSFNSAATSSLTNDLDATAATNRPLLAPLWDDLGGELATSTARYQTTGTAPNRVFTFEWRDWSWNYNASGAVVSFQVRLYETSNRVEFVYRPETTAPNSPSASIGLSGTGTPVDFLSLSSTGAAPTASATSETTTLSTVPASGQVYAFTPAPVTGCPTPRNLSATATTASTATLTWSVTGGGGTFSINYGPTGFVPGTGGQTVSSTGPSVTLTGLSASTDYQFYVTQLCSGGSSSPRSNAGTFRTDCVTPLYATVPFQETFENTWLSRCNTREVPGNNWRNTPATGNNSWRREDDGAAANWTSATSYLYSPTGAQGSAHSARFHSGYSSAGLIGTMDLFVNMSTAGSKRLSFDYINTSGADSLAVQISTDGGLTFGPQLLRLGQAATFQGQTLTLTGTSATTVIRFRARADFGSTDIGLDNVRVESLNGCLSPLGLAVTGTTATTATVSWASAGTGTYTVFYGPTGFTPGGAGSQQMTGITGTSTTISGLTASTEYQFYVRQDCGGTTISATAGPVSFRTDCVTPLYATVPFQETFENTWLSRCNTREVPGNNWRNTPATGNNSWRREDDGAAANWTNATSYLYSPTGAQGSAHSARFHSGYSSAGLLGTMDLFVNMSGSGNRELSFDYVNTSGADSLAVQISTDGGLTFGPQLLRLGQSASFQTKTLALTSTSATTVIRFRARADFGSTDIGLDNVTIASCARVGNVAVSNITGTTATVSFTPLAGVSSYTVVATPATGAPVTVQATGSPVNLTGLTGLTQYTVGVTSSCAPGQTSVPVTTTFSTLLPPTTNDEPCTATVLPVGTGGSYVTTNSSNLGATATTPNGYNNPGCSTAANPKDVWFTVAMPSSGSTSLTIVATGNPAGQVRLFSAASCNGPFTQIACKGSNNANTPAGVMVVNGLTAGATYYVSVSGFGSSDTQGAFALQVGQGALAVKGELARGEVSVFPNPSTTGELTLRIAGVSAANAQAQLINSLGQRVLTQQVSLRGGTAEQPLAVKGLAKGLYTLRVQIGDTLVARKVVLE